MDPNYLNKGFDDETDEVFETMFLERPSTGSRLKVRCPEPMTLKDMDKYCSVYFKGFVVV